MLRGVGSRTERTRVAARVGVPREDPDGVDASGRALGVLPNSASGAMSDWGLSCHTVDLGGSVRDRDSHEGERGRAHDVRSVTQSVHVFEERKHAGREGPFVSVGCDYLGFAFEYNRELPSGAGWGSVSRTSGGVVTKMTPVAATVAETSSGGVFSTYGVLPCGSSTSSNLEPPRPSFVILMYRTSALSHPRRKPSNAELPLGGGASRSQARPPSAPNSSTNRHRTTPSRPARTTQNGMSATGAKSAKSGGWWRPLVRYRASSPRRVMSCSVVIRRQIDSTDCPVRSAAART